MHVAVILMKYNPFGGYERQAAVLARLLVETGNKVTVFANRWTRDSHRGVEFKKVPMLKGMSWLKVLSFALLSKYYLNREKERFDVIVAFDRTLVMDIYRAGNACHKEWLNFRKGSGTISDRISIAINPLHLVINKIERHIFSKVVPRIVVLSQMGAQQIKQHYSVNDNRFVVIPPAVEVNHFTLDKLSDYRKTKREEIGFTEDTLVLLHVGSGFRIKGLKSTIGALEILRKRGIKVELVVVGDDRRGIHKYGRLCHKLGLEEYIHFCGGVNEVEKFYAASDIFVMPALFETFCAAAVEALAYGLPLIIGRGAGVSSIIEEERVGKVIHVPADSCELADMIEETAMKEKELGLSGTAMKERERRRSVAYQCDCSAVMKKFLYLIAQVADERKQRRANDAKG